MKRASLASSSKAFRNSEIAWVRTSSVTRHVRPRSLNDPLFRQNFVGMPGQIDEHVHRFRFDASSFLATTNAIQLWLHHTLTHTETVHHIYLACYRFVEGRLPFPGIEGQIRRSRTPRFMPAARIVRNWQCRSPLSSDRKPGVSCSEEKVTLGLCKPSPLCTCTEPRTDHNRDSTPKRCCLNNEFSHTRQQALLYQPTDSSLLRKKLSSSGNPLSFRSFSILS